MQDQNFDQMYLNRGLKFYNNVIKSELYKALQESNIEIKQDTNVVFTDSS